MYILVPVLCTLSFILLLVCIWLFYLKAKKSQSIYQKKGKPGQSIVPPDFMIPCRVKAVEEQLPAVSYEKVTVIPGLKMHFIVMCMWLLETGDTLITIKP